MLEENNNVFGYFLHGSVGEGYARYVKDEDSFAFVLNSNGRCEPNKFPIEIRYSNYAFVGNIDEASNISSLFFVNAI